MTPAFVEPDARRRALAYDDVYRQWRSKRVTVESFESWAKDFLRAAPGEKGHLNGNEIEWALQRLKRDGLEGKVLLDYCCGAGRSSIYFALLGARVRGFDRSAEAIRLAQESAEQSGVEDRVSFCVMDGRNLAYPDDEFDLAFCGSALHIVIDYPRCATELARVLKPGGRAVFCEEALGHNPLVEVIRRMRRRKYAECGGRALTYDDLYAFGSAFDGMHIQHFNLLSQVKSFLGEAAARHGMTRAALRALDRVDRWILAALPVLKRYCGKVVVEYVKAP